MMNPESFVTLKPDSRKPFLGFLFVYVIFCLLTYRHYGVTWDEFLTYMSGGQWIKYYLGQPNNLFISHPVLTPMYQSHSFFNGALIRILSFSKTILPDRMHLVNMLLAIPIFWCFYELLKACFNDWRWALMGPLVLVLTPRFFGDLPANATDVPFAVIYFACLSAMVLRRDWIQRPWLQNVLLGALFGLAMGIRIVGFTLLPIYTLFRLYGDGLLGKKWAGKNFKQWFWPEAAGFFLVILVSQVLLCFLWPYIGKDYFHHVGGAFQISSNFNYFDKKLLFWGQWIQPIKNFHWSYLPGWMLAVTPIFILGFSVYSFVRVGAFWKNEIYFVMVLALAFNLALYLILKPLIFNGLRHYLFLVPIISLLACLGMIDFFAHVHWRPVRFLAVMLIPLNVLSVATEMVRLYPYDYVYFNELVGGLKGAQGKFELDYWGASLREATEWLRDNECKDPNRIYKIKWACDQWQQVPFCSPNMAGYTEYKEKEADYCMVLNGLVDSLPPKSGTMIHAVEREGVPLAFVYKINKQDQK